MVTDINIVYSGGQIFVLHVFEERWDNILARTKPIGFNQVMNGSEAPDCNEKVLPNLEIATK